MDKIIFHVDFDSYFASAHRVLNPQYENKPIAIGKNQRRAIAASVSYELKNKGVKAGWPNFKIIEVEPKTIFIEPNFELYVNLSNKIFDFLAKKYTDKIEVYSIDECWIDMSNLCNEKNAVYVAQKMQAQIKAKFRIPVSIGISYNKFLAKMTTDLAKPFNVLFTHPSDIKDRIWPLHIEKYFGIGKSTAEKLIALGVDTIGKLAARSKHDIYLYEIFRSQTPKFVNEARGQGSDKLNYQHNELKSIGNEITFLSIDLDDRDEILKILYKLSEKVSLRAQNRNLLGYVITLSLRTTERVWKRQQTTLKFPINDHEKIYEYGAKIFNRIFKDDYIRGIGIKLSNLVSEFEIGHPQNIFEHHQAPLDDKIKLLVKDINNKIKSKALQTGSEFVKDKTKNIVHSRFLNEDMIKKGI